MQYRYVVSPSHTIIWENNEINTVGNLSLFPLEVAQHTISLYVEEKSSIHYNSFIGIGLETQNSCPQQQQSTNHFFSTE